MKSGRRGRRGGRRQRRREAEAKARAEQQPGASPPPEVAPPDAPAGRPSEVAPPDAAAPAPRQPVPIPEPAPVAHPRPMSARELVARLEARRAEGASGGGHDATREQPSGAGEHAAQAATGAWHGASQSEGRPPEAGEKVAPRRFTVAGQEWLASLAGRGTGGTGRVAQARLAAIRFSTSAEPERVAAEVLVAGPGLDALYDDELAELLERGLRSRKGNG